jgi:hypothetical protein
MQVLVSRNEIVRKLVKNCPRFPLDFATYRWAACNGSFTGLGSGKGLILKNPTMPFSG